MLTILGGASGESVGITTCASGSDVGTADGATASRHAGVGADTVAVLPFCVIIDGVDVRAGFTRFSETRCCKEGRCPEACCEHAVRAARRSNDAAEFRVVWSMGIVVFGAVVRVPFSLRRSA